MSLRNQEPLSGQKQLLANRQAYPRKRLRISSIAGKALGPLPADLYHSKQLAFDETLGTLMCARAAAEYATAAKAASGANRYRNRFVISWLKCFIWLASLMTRVQVNDVELWQPDQRKLYLKSLDARQRRSLWSRGTMWLFYYAALRFGALVVMQYLQDFYLFRLRASHGAGTHESLNHLALRGLAIRDELAESNRVAVVAAATAAAAASSTSAQITTTTTSTPTSTTNSTNIAHTPNSSLTAGPISAGGRNAHTDELLVKFAVARSWLEFMNCPYRDLTFTIELLWIVLLWLCFISYWRPYLIHRYVRPLELGVVRMMKDSDRERRSYTEISLDVLNKMVTSRLLVSKSPCGRAWHHQSLGPAVSGLNQHAPTVERLTRLALAGQLEPDNRRHSQMVHISVSTFYTALGLMLTIVTLATCLGVVAPNLAFVNKVMPIYLTTGGFFLHLEFLIVTYMLAVCATFYLCCTNAVVLDRSSLARALERRMQLCLNAGRHLLAASGPEQPALRDRFDDKLALVIAHYKLAVAHSRPGQRTLSQLCVIMIEVLLVGPAVIVCHSPFLDQRLISIVVPAFACMVLCIDACLVPVCYLNKNACRTLTTANRLAAMLADLQQPGRKLAACDSHLAWQLRAELTQPELFVKRLSVLIGGSALNFARLSRFHFWSSMVMCLASATATRVDLTPAGSAQVSNPFRFVF